MAYDEKLADRVRSALARHRRITEKKMFGGLAFMLKGRMCCGVLNDDLVVRVGPEHYAAALTRPYARPMDFTGRPISGFVYVAAGGVRGDAALAKWLRQAADHASSLPARKVTSEKRRKDRRTRA
ncbi:MAG: TfoX/Sxy family protein [Betaproteobacteria bacterium]|nr:MAG: TfoX/Sxy family protein [Betaproteobacteria bacterium]